MMDVLLQMQEDMVQSKIKTELLSGMVSHLSQVVQEMETKVEKLELNHM